MANYTLANLVKAQIKLASSFANNDKRFVSPDVFKLFIGQRAEQFFPSYKELKTSDSRAVEANYFKRTAQALITTGRSHNHTGTGGDSGVLPLAWVTNSTTFSITLKQADKSIYSWQELFNNDIENKVIDFANGLNTTAGTYLFDNRTGVNTASVKGTFDGTNDVYVIESAFKEESITITKVVAELLKYKGVILDLVCDSYSYTEFLRQAAQGAQNATNTSFQFMGTTFVHDPNLTARAVALDVTYTGGFWLAVPQGYVACPDWIPVENRQGVETKENTYGTLMNPVDGLQYAVHSYETRADGTGVNGEKQDVLTQVELSIDLSFNHAPSSVVDETPIMAFAVATV
tara:strand:- start:20240 stop:21277 length:1038 start_codon:yes stop_codon:yes gene_type:complete